MGHYYPHIDIDEQTLPQIQQVYIGKLSLIAWRESQPVRVLTAVVANVMGAEADENDFLAGFADYYSTHTQIVSRGAAKAYLELSRKGLLPAWCINVTHGKLKAAIYAAAGEEYQAPKQRKGRNVQSWQEYDQAG